MDTVASGLAQKAHRTAGRWVPRGVTKLKRMNFAINCGGRTITGRHFRREVPIHLPPSGCVQGRHLTAAGYCGGRRPVTPGLVGGRGGAPGGGEGRMASLWEVDCHPHQTHSSGVQPRQRLQKRYHEVIFREVKLILMNGK